MPAPDAIRKTDILLWCAALAIAIFLATRGWHLVFWHAGVHPVSNDSFYHLARVLDIAADPASIHEFDSRLHWPDGMWIVWPWAYDYLLGVTAGLLREETRPAALMFTPLLLLAANLTLVGVIARRLLNPHMAALGLLVYAAAPSTKSLHKLGYLDHHPAEHTLFLLVMYLALRWRSRPGSTGAAGALGIALGTASAFHNGLFILQLPVLAMLFFDRVFARKRPDTRATTVFCTALLGTQFLVLLPSHHFHQLNYGFFYLSWFHLHVAGLTCLAAVALNLRDRRLMWGLLAGAALLALPAARQAMLGIEFMSAQLPWLDAIREANSPYWGSLTFRQVTEHFSAIIWLLPVFFAWGVMRLFRAEPGTSEPAALVFLLFGAVLLATQVRFQQFGMLSLALLPLLALQNVFRRPRDVLYAGILFLGVYLQSPGLLSYNVALGGSLRYARAVELIDVLERVCAQRPGLLLAAKDWGNFLRYRTDCSLLANNFIMTPEDFAALRYSDYLFSLEPGALLVEWPEVKYVLVSAMEPQHLGERLLSDRQFDRFRSLGEIRNIQGEPIARAFEVLPESPADATGSAPMD